MVDHVKGYSPKEQKSLIEVAYVAHLKVQVLSFNANLFSSPLRVPRPSYPFRENFGDQVKGRFPLKSLIEVLYVAHLKIQVLSVNMNLFYSPYRVPRPSYPFQDKFRRLGNVSFTEKAKIVN